MTIFIKNGLVRIDETSEDRMINFHLKRGFAMLTAFRSEYTLLENRSHNRQLASDLKSLGYSYTKITGGYIEKIDRDNPNWDIANSISGDDDHRELEVMEESFFVMMYNVKTKSPVSDFKTFRKDILALGELYEQDSVLVSPPEGEGTPQYFVTNSRNGNVGSVDCTFNSFTLASISNTYFSMKEKTINKARAKRRQGVGGVKFESAWVDEPCHTISGVRGRESRNETAPFGSHYYKNSNLNNANVEMALEDRVSKLESIIFSK